MKLRTHLALLALACISASLHAQEYLGQLSANPCAPEAPTIVSP